METVETWVIVDYFPHEPSMVYGMFKSEQEAREYAKRQRFGIAPGAYEIKCVLNIEEE